MKWLRSEGGGSLIEALVALGLIAIAAGNLAATSVTSVKRNGTSRAISTASALIQDKLEHLRALDGASNPADLTPGQHTDAANPIVAAGGRFTRAWNVTASSPRRGMATVVVSVTWMGREASTIRGVTYVCTTATCS